MTQKERYDTAHLIGQKFNRWTILKDLGRRGTNRLDKKRIVWCRCECGYEGERDCSSVKSGNSKSCGCHNLEVHTKRLTTHGLNSHPLYIVWKQMRRRCLSPTATFYSNYGGRGVTICKEWDSFKNFHDWAISNGWESGLVLDKDVKSPNQVGDCYCPEYCSFVTPKVNMRNMSTNRMIEYEGETKCLAEWAEKYGICRKRLSRRLDKGMEFMDAVNAAKDSFYGFNGTNKKPSFIKTY